MNTAIRFGFYLIVIVCMVSFTGCAKKSEPQPPSTPAGNTVKVPQEPNVTVPARETAPTIVSKLTGAALATVPMEDVKAEIDKLGVEQLKAKATDYKDAILAQKAELATATEKLKEIPVTQLMSADAKTMQSNIATLTKTISNLNDRFQLYNNKIKELGGSAIELTK